MDYDEFFLGMINWPKADFHSHALSVIQLGVLTLPEHLPEISVKIFHNYYPFSSNKIIKN